jgi:hypothetical protein
MTIGKKVKTAQVATILVITAAVVVAAYWSWGNSGIQQPVAFPHKTHIVSSTRGKGRRCRQATHGLLSRLSCGRRYQQRRNQEAAPVRGRRKRNSMEARVALARTRFVSPSSPRYLRAAYLPNMSWSDGDAYSSSKPCAEGTADGRLHCLSRAPEISESHTRKDGTNYKGGSAASVCGLHILPSLR